MNACDQELTDRGTADAPRSRSRSALPSVLRWAQVSLFFLFLADVYVYSILDALLGRYLGTLGIAQEHMSVAYAIYGMLQIVASVVLLLMQGWGRCAKTSVRSQFTAVLVAVAAASGSTVAMIIWPASYTVLLLVRGLQGTCGAVYSILAMVLLARSFPPEWQMQAVAFMTAGQTFGDSLAPVLGAVLYDFSGIRAAYITQGAVYCLALTVLLVLGGWWWKRSSSSSSQQQQLKEQNQQIMFDTNGEVGSQGDLELGSAFITRVSLTSHSVEAVNEARAAPAQIQAAALAKSMQAAAATTAAAAGVSIARASPRCAPDAPNGIYAFDKTMSHARITSTCRNAAPTSSRKQQAECKDQGKSERRTNSQCMELTPAFHQDQLRRAAVGGLKPAKPQTHSWIAAPESNSNVDGGSAGCSAPMSHSAHCCQGTVAPCEMVPTAVKKLKEDPTVWKVLFQWYVVGECGQAFLAQLLRTALNVLIPLAMASTPTWLVGVVFLGEAAFAVLSPFVLDYILALYPGLSTARVLLASVSVMGVSASVTLLFYLSVPGAMVCMAVLGSAHSMIEALVFKRVVDYVAGAENPAALNACMSAYSLFYVSGFTVGALIAGVPDLGNVLQQQVAAAAMAGVMVLFTGGYQLLLRKGCIPSKPPGHQA